MKTLFFLILLFSISNADEGFFKDSWKAKVFNTPSAVTTKSLSTNTPTVTITINSIDTINKVYASVFSNNTNGYIGKSILTDESGLNNMKNANIYSMRLPGGNWSNIWFWDGENHWGNNLKDDYLSDIKSKPTTTWTRTSDELLELCDLVGAKPQICVNYSLARYIDAPDAVQQAAHYAADWVRDVNIKKGLGVEYWEVGNENYGSWQAGYEVGGVKITATEYGKDFCVFADSMHAVDPTIKIGAVVYESESGSNVADWNKDVLTEAKDHMDFLAVHEYFTYASNLNDVTVQQVLDGVPVIGEVKDMLETAVETYTGNPKGHYPIAMTEYNMRAGAKDHSYLSAVFIAQALGEYIKNGYGLVNIWDLTNAYPKDGAGDHGMFSRNDPNVDDYTPHASFYAYYYYTHYFGDYLIGAFSSKDNVKVYASKFSTGHLGLVVVNQGSSSETVEFNLGDYSIGENYYMYSLQSDNITANNFNINGEVSASGYFGPLNYGNIKPYSSAINGKNFKLDLDKYSVNFIIIDPAVVTSVDENKTESKDLNLNIYPNPFNPTTTISYSIANDIKNGSVKVYDVKGELVKTLYSGNLKSGIHTSTFNGSSMASGIYFVRVNIGVNVFTKKMILLK